MAIVALDTLAGPPLGGFVDNYGAHRLVMDRRRETQLVHPPDTMISVARPDVTSNSAMPSVLVDRK